MSAIVPWTTPGQAPCCCGIGCPDQFDEAFWDRRATQAQIVAAPITPAFAAELFAGGTFTSTLSASLQMSGTGGGIFESTTSISDTKQTTNVGGCYLSGSSLRGLSLFPSANNSAVSFATVSPTSGTRPSGSGDATIKANATVELTYQIEENPTANTYQLYLFFEAGISTGEFRFPQGGFATEFRIRGGVSTSGTNGPSFFNASFQGINVSLSRALYGFIPSPLTYGVVYSSGSASMNTTITHTPTAP